MRAGLPQFVRRRLDPEKRYGLRLTLFAFAFVLVVVPFTTVLFNVVAGGPLTRADGSVADRLNEVVHRSPGLVTALEAVTWLGRPVFLGLIVGAAALVLWRHGRRRLALYLAATVIGAGLVNSAVKVFVDRPRPQVDHPVATAFGSSFPSGHSMAAVATYGALLLVFLPVLRGRFRLAAVAATVLLILVIGSTRLLLGVHFLTDVVAGYVLGLAWLVGATAAFEAWRVESGGRPVRPLEEGIEPEAGAALRSR
jgi:undecaprenyl-diphosphatase